MSLAYFTADIDECRGPDKCCTDLCNNNPGGYTCGCQPGFILNMDGCTCDGKHVKICVQLLYECLVIKNSRGNQGDGGVYMINDKTRELKRCHCH